MFNHYDKIDLCSYVQCGKVKYFKEYTLKGRIVGTECISFSEFVRLLNQFGANKQSAKELAKWSKKRRPVYRRADRHKLRQLRRRIYFLEGEKMK